MDVTKINLVRGAGSRKTPFHAAMEYMVTHVHKLEQPDFYRFCVDKFISSGGVFVKASGPDEERVTSNEVKGDEWFKKFVANGRRNLQQRQWLAAKRGDEPVVPPSEPPSWLGLKAYVTQGKQESGEYNLHIVLSEDGKMGIKLDSFVEVGIMILSEITSNPHIPLRFTGDVVLRVDEWDLKSVFDKEGAAIQLLRSHQGKTVRVLSMKNKLSWDAEFPECATRVRDRYRAQVETEAERAKEHRTKSTAETTEQKVQPHGVALPDGPAVPAAVGNTVTATGEETKAKELSPVLDILHRDSTKPKEDAAATRRAVLAARREALMAKQAAAAAADKEKYAKIRAAAAEEKAKREKAKKTADELAKTAQPFPPKRPKNFFYSARRRELRGSFPWEKNDATGLAGQDGNASQAGIAAAPGTGATGPEDDKEHHHDSKPKPKSKAAPVLEGDAIVNDIPEPPAWMIPAVAAAAGGRLSESADYDDRAESMWEELMESMFDDVFEYTTEYRNWKESEKKEKAIFECRISSPCHKLCYKKRRDMRDAICFFGRSFLQKRGNGWKTRCIFVALKQVGLH